MGCNTNERNELMMIGDVFLMEGTSKFSPYLMASQKAFIYGKTRSSHVMFSFGDGVFVHSTTKPGVEIITYKEVMPECKEGWRVIRNINLTDIQRTELQKASLFFLKQDYNFALMAPSNDHSSFCSELVAKIYEKAGVPLFDKNTGKVAPGHFDRAADEAVDWKDVTEEYKLGFAENDSNARSFDLVVSTLRAAVQKRSFMLQNTDMMMGMLKGMVSPDAYSEIYKMEAEFRKTKNISFWNEKLYPDLQPVQSKDSNTDLQPDPKSDLQPVESKDSKPES